MCIHLFNCCDCNRLYFLIGYSKKNKETLLFARISNIYLVQIEKYSRDYFTYSPYRRPSVSCLSVGPFVRPSINTQVSSIFLFRPLTRLGKSWKVFLLQPHKDSRADFFFYLLLTTAFVLVVNYVPARGRTDGRVDGRTGGSVWHFFRSGV